MKAFAQFMMSIGSMGTLDTSSLTQILLLNSDDDLESEASNLGQILSLVQSQETVQQFGGRSENWTVAAEMEHEDGSFTYQLVRF